MRAGNVGQQRRDGNADKRVQSVPYEVEGGDFVGEELQPEQRQRNADDPPRLQNVQAGGQGNDSEAPQQPQRRHRGVYVEPGGEAGGRKHGGCLVGVEGHNTGMRRRSGRFSCRTASREVKEPLAWDTRPPRTAYSIRRACIGSTRAARRAGSNAASRAMNVISRTPQTRTSGSAELTL